MNIVLNLQALESNNISEGEILFLLSVYFKVNLSEVEQSLVSKSLITRDCDTSKPYRLTYSAIDIIESVLLDSDKTVPQKETLLPLVNRLQELFPKGSKPGGTSWRGNQREISQKLQRWSKHYGTVTLPNGDQHTWTDDEVCEATRKYVESFNGDYTYMRQLKYFILKFVRRENEDGVGFQEEVSDLSTFLESEESDINSNQDWTIQVR